MEMGLLFVSKSLSPCFCATFPSSSLSSVYISLRCVTSSLNPLTPRDNRVINTSKAGLEEARPKQELKINYKYN